MEGNESRMVKTPWSEQEIPFTTAASIGTQKVIRDHATIGIVVTTDGTIRGTAAKCICKSGRTDGGGTECDPQNHMSFC